MTLNYSYLSIFLLSLALLCPRSASLSATPFFEISSKYIETGTSTSTQDPTQSSPLHSTETPPKTHSNSFFSPLR